MPLPLIYNYFLINVNKRILSLLLYYTIKKKTRNTALKELEYILKRFE